MACPSAGPCVAAMRPRSSGVAMQQHSLATVHGGERERRVSTNSAASSSGYGGTGLARGRISSSLQPTLQPQLSDRLREDRLEERRPTTPPGGATVEGCFGFPFWGSEAKSTSSPDMRMLMEDMKREIMGELRREMQDLANAVRQSNREVQASVHRLSQEVRRLQLDVDQVQASGDQGPVKRLMACVMKPICGGEEKKAIRAKRPSELPAESLPPAVSLATIDEKQVLASQPSGGRKACRLSPVVQHFGAASRILSEACKEVDRMPFIDGLSEYAKVLNHMGGGMGSYLESNIVKLRSSKADQNKSGYRDWLLTELPVHQQTSYQKYVDDSAWMANLWIGWTLEFFAELFAELHQGQDTKAAADAAYNRTLYNHHNFFQRTAFTAAVKKLPPRDDIFAKLRGEASFEDVRQEVAEFVRLARPLAVFCLDVNEMLDQRMQAEKKVFLKR